MCGIAGFVEFFSLKETETSLLAMQKAIKHRGPDDEGHYFTQGLGLAHTRLSIIDLSQKAHQPMRRGNMIIIYNGEIFNYKELQKELQELGHDFRSDSDTEVVLAAYQEWGRGSLLKFNGMFAFAIYDKEKKTLFLARDKTGIKPFFYYQNDNAIIFASEIKAIKKAVSFKKEISPLALEDYLRFGYTTGQQTIWKDCYRLMPGELIEVDVQNRKIHKEKYWIPHFSNEKNSNPKKIKAEVKAALIEEIQGSMVSDVPVALCLSGGVDSNIIASILVKELEMDISTFSVGSQQADFDENHQAERVAAHLGVQHKSLILDPREMHDFFMNTIEHFDEPQADQNILSFRYISRMAKEDGFKVLLNGVGGDELFFGYPSIKLAMAVRSFFKLPYSIRRIFPKSIFKGNHRLYRGMEVLHSENFQNATANIWGKCFFENEIDKLFLEKRPSEATSWFFEILKTEDDLINRLMKLNLSSYLCDNSLHMTDMSSMAEGVEMRVPYLTNQVIDFGMSISSEDKTRGGELKSLLKDIQAEYLPSELWLKEKKGFNPFKKKVWLDEYFVKEVQKYLDVNLLNRQGLFNASHIEAILQKNQKEGGNQANKIWSLLVFQIWAKHNL